ncbi:glycoside hydrolase family 5 protein [Mesorhizobium sp. BR1-1-16]|uniref:glycoside hydrolase family 5 protein n=1 Tax=Mesorhizobium sp. BR1-1-16 TaxID=2876653 RepID=UPI001CCC7DDB|nr:glycoside hydrolase family 5 protein [Mesorhizobium sp. BR1-1-16]MBZ9936164.1 glycoside hydrolase family 5 protein [Mesorhizobium sp. BR1-1-16]
MKRKFGHGIAGLLALAAMTTTAVAEPCLRGVNLAGAEFGTLPGKLHTDYTYPTKATIDYVASTGATAIRLPFRWERLQPKLGKPFDPAELAALDETVADATKAGLTVILDPHNYAYYNEQRIGSDAVPTASFASFWARLSAHDRSEPKVVFSLMNEPYDIHAEDWLVAVNLAIAAIRKAGAANLILVPGTAYTGAHSWTKDLPVGNNSKVMAGVADPLNRYAYDFHQYLDADFSGRNAECSGADEALAGIDRVTAWLKANGKRGFLGEFAAADDAACLAAMTKLVTAVDSAKAEWIGWTYWAAGEWWPPDYMFNAQPTAEGDRAQIAALKPLMKVEDASCGVVTK